MRKRTLLLALYFPLFCFAQTDVLFDEWWAALSPLSSATLVHDWFPSDTGDMTDSVGGKTLTVTGLLSPIGLEAYPTISQDVYGSSTTSPDLGESMSFSMWALPRTNQFLAYAFAIADRDNSGSYDFQVNYSAANTTVTFTVWDSSGTIRSVNSTSGLSYVWHHYAGTYDASSNAMYLYVDGEVVDTGTAPLPLDNDSCPFRIGDASWNPTYQWFGSIDRVRLYAGALSASEVRAQYESESGRYSYFYPQDNGSWEFYGSPNYVTAADSGSLSLSHTGLTISAWVRKSKASTDGVIVAAKCYNTSTAEYFFRVTPAGAVHMCMYGSGTSANQAHGKTGDGVVPFDGKFYHVAAIVTSKTNMILCVNGVSQSVTYSGAGTFTAMANTASVFDMGVIFRGYPAARTYSKGRVDEVAIWGRALGTNDIVDLYNGGRGLAVSTNGVFPTSGNSMSTSLRAAWDCYSNSDLSGNGNSVTVSCYSMAGILIGLD